MESEVSILGSLPDAKILRRRFDKGKPFKIEVNGATLRVSFIKDYMMPTDERRRWIVISPEESDKPIFGIGMDERMEHWIATYIRNEGGQIGFSHDPINLLEPS